MERHTNTADSGTSDPKFVTHDFSQFTERGEGSNEIEGTELAAYTPHPDSGTPETNDVHGDTSKSALKKFWQSHVSIVVETTASRDHLANERTFLAWVRTSLALSMMGVVTTQLFTLQASHVPNMNLSFFSLGEPLGCVCQGAALVNVLIGAYRFWYQQSAMVKGLATGGGYDLLFITLLVVSVSSNGVWRVFKEGF
jgi:uncharacterized membrane protein YidH (DUF202 family)